MPLMTESQRLPTSGARAVEHFSIGGSEYLLVPQIAYDSPSSPAGMNGGDSNTDVGVYVRKGDEYVPAGTLPGTGGEDAEFFAIGDRHFLAIASVRMGSGPYNFRSASPIYEWIDGAFEPFQSIAGYAAKQWRHFEIENTHYLALAQNRPGPASLSSMIYRWNGVQFEEFQEIPSRGGYNIDHFEIGGDHYIAHADHSMPSKLYKWDGGAFVEHQDLVSTGGRAFALISNTSGTYLAVACMFAESLILRWNGERFVEHQELEGGLGGREFTQLELAGKRFLIRVNFITGSQQDPHPELDSFVYTADESAFDLIERFPTSGGTDVTVFDVADERAIVAVSNALTADAGFRADTVLYTFSAPESDN
jgi:hypothetical protein